MPGDENTLWREHLLKGLTPAQCDAVVHDDGPLAVLAGPGTGKTVVIIRRIAALIARGVEPESILGLTFSVKASEEMRQRLGALLSSDGASPVGVVLAQRVNIHTFHGLGLRLIGRFPDVLGLPGTPQVADRPQELRLLRDVISRHQILPESAGEGREAIVGEALPFIELFRNQGLGGEEALAWARRWAEQLPGEADQSDEARASRARHRRFAEMARAYALLVAAMRARGVCAMGDLLTLAGELFERGGAADIIRGDYRHVVVDEFQDVNAAQIRLLRGLCPPASRPDLCVVGDDDQAIYAFRGADERAFFKFDRDYRGPRRIALEDNWRSTADVLAVAGAVIARQAERFEPGKIIRASAAHAHDPSGLVRYVRLGRSDEDGPQIASMILAMRAVEPARAWDSFAVIARGHAALDHIAAALALRRIPVDRRHATGWRDDAAVQDAMAWIRLVTDDRDITSATRVLRRPPARVPADVVARKLGEYRAAIARWVQRLEGATDPGGALAFVAAAMPDHPGAVQAARVHQWLMAEAAELPADQSILRILKVTGLGSAELSPPGLRTRRVLSLVALVRLARSKQTRLESPGGLREWLAYLDDLPDDADDDTPEDRVEGAGEAGAEEADAGHERGVRLLTAHAAKGLEFDTVFLPRVNPQRGFPSTKTRDEPPLPEGLIDRAGDVRTAKDRALAEERRLFYVACTRAQRRLVLLANWTQKASSSVSYIDELVREKQADASWPIRTVTIADLDAEAARAGVPPLPPDPLARHVQDAARLTTVAEAVGSLKARAREAVALALDRLDRPEVGPEELDEAAGALRRSAELLAGVAYSAVHGAAPAWMPSADREAARGVEELLRLMREQSPPAPGEPSGPIRLPAVKPPLGLSYSQLDSYRRCPRCYYVRHVLGLPESANTRTTLGDVAHRALQGYYQSWRDADAAGVPRPGPDRLLALAAGVWASSLRPGQSPEPHERDMLLAQLRTMIERLHDPEANILELEVNVRWPFEHAGHAHHLTAKIDRVDDLGGGRYRIIDYKTGQDWKSLAQPAADDLQLGLYALALDHLYGDGAPVPGVAEYWLLRSGGKGTLRLEDVDRPAVLAKVTEAIDGMLAGRWTRSEDCKPGSSCEVLDL